MNNDSLHDLITLETNGIKFELIHENKKASQSKFNGTKKHNFQIRDNLIFNGTFGHPTISDFTKSQ